ncbi:MAG: molybdopterin-dependent oxidoreductase [Pseudomonadota bacterium]
MNWDRRAFVKFAVGAVVGIHASPLVPKLMDDSAIWTQNWNWVPTPEKGALAFANSVNPETGTGVRTRLIRGRLQGERLIRVEGNPEHPASQGGVVPQDASAPQNLYYGDFRVQTPLVWDSLSGRHLPVSWDEALDLVAKKLAEIHKAGKPETLAALGGDPDTVDGEILSRFMAAFGSPNLAFTPSAKQTLALAGWAMFGNGDIGFDLDHASFVVSFGTPLLEGFGAPVATRKAFANWRKDYKHTGTLIQVEPRASVTASQADTWLACQPGAEGAVALAMCQVLVSQGLYDKGLVDSALGFGNTDKGPGFKALLDAKYTPAMVEAISGVPAKKIAEAAVAFAKAQKAVAVCGPGPAGEPGRLFDFMAVLALNCLKGNLGKEGGLVARPALGLKPLGEAVAAPMKPRLDALAAKRLLNTYDPLSLAQAGLAGAPYKPAALLVMNCNPAYNGPQASLMAQFIQSVPFVVAVSAYLDETASLAQVILPAGTWLETWGDSVSPYGSAVATYGVHRPLVKAYAQVKAAGDAILGLAAKLGGPVAQALPLAATEDALKARAAGLGDFDKLAQQSWWAQDKPAYGPLAFKTPSGGLELFSMGLHNLLTAKAGDGAAMQKILAGLGVTASGSAALMPHFEPVAGARGHGKLAMMAIPSLRASARTQTTTPYMLQVMDDNTLRNRTELVVEMNPATAAELHLGEDDRVRVDSAAGGTEARVHLFAGAAPGMVFMPVGLGHTAAGNAYTFERGGNYNSVAQATADPLSGLPVWSLTQVAVTKL